MPELHLAEKLAKFSSQGYVIAPAGYGKTHLIALAVKQAASRQLVLTHTFAGVNSIAKKMRTLEVSSAQYELETIASWALRLCLAYPQTSNWHTDKPAGQQWEQLYNACSSLLEKQFIKQILMASYTGIYVDEYQDCSHAQHNLICKIAEILPCRLLGDPMQAIFDFAETPVNWENSIYPYFECLGTLTTPWRWHKSGAIALGNWLKDSREKLLKGQKLVYPDPLPKGLKLQKVDLFDFNDRKRHSVFYEFLKTKETVIAVGPGHARAKNVTHQIAKLLGGKFSSIEEVEGVTLFSFLKKFDQTSLSSARLLHAIEFAKKCMNGVDNLLSAPTKRGEHANLTKSSRNPDIIHAANRYLEQPTSRNLKKFFLSIRNESTVYRKDLLNRFLKVLTLHEASPTEPIEKVANQYQIQFRSCGRPIKHSKLLGTILLVKGLEYDHAIILDADTLKAKELYVALTRGSKSITILSKTDRGFV